MSTTSAALGGRIDVSTTSLGLAIGDAALIGLFVISGEISHGVDPITQTGVVIDTALPFYIGWVIASFALGAYSRAARETPKRAALMASGTWIVAALIGQGLRATSLFHGDFAIAFVLVSIGVGLVLLVPWRVVVSWFVETSSPEH
jgi:hypothetical protein